MNICTKYGFDILIISGSYGGHRRHTTYDGRRTTPRVWHKLPTGELKTAYFCRGNNWYPASRLPSCLIQKLSVIQ